MLHNLNCFFSEWLLSPSLTLTRHNIFIFTLTTIIFFTMIISIFSSLRIYQYLWSDQNQLIYHFVRTGHILVILLMAKNPKNCLFPKSHEPVVQILLLFAGYGVHIALLNQPELYWTQKYASSRWKKSFTWGGLWVYVCGWVDGWWVRGWVCVCKK